MNNKNVIYLFAMSLVLFGCSGGEEDSYLEQLPPEKVTYDDQIKALFYKHCISCHNGSTDPGMPSTIFSNYSEVKIYLEEILVRVNATSNPMPPPPNSPLSSAEKNLLQQWKDDGLLEN